MAGGNADLPQIGSAAEFRRDRLSLLARAAAAGPLVRVPLGSSGVLLASSPETVHALLVEKAEHFRKTDAFHGATALLGQGLPLVEGARHRRQRRQMAPGFTHARISAYAASMAELAERAQARWQDGQHLDLAGEITKLNLSIVGRTLFASDLEARAREIDGLIATVDRTIAERLNAPFAFPYWVPTASNLRFRRALRELNRAIDELIEKRRGSAESGDLLSMLFSVLDERELHDETLSLLIACQDTTPNALAWACYLLMKHPEMQAALVREGEHYALAVFRETLRLYPPVYMTARQATRDLELAGSRIARGSIVFANIYGLHRRSTTFDEPDQFRPERWDNDFERRLPRASYLPFIDGPRVCIGNHFALLEGQILLSTFARHLTFELDPAGRAVEGDPQITLRPRGGLPVIVRRRASA